MTVIHKTLEDWRVSPNLTDYEQTRAEFRWSDGPQLCEGMGSAAVQHRLRRRRPARRRARRRHAQR